MPESDNPSVENNDIVNTEEFNFDEWAKTLGLSRKVIQCLRQEELVRKEALKLVEVADLKSIGLPLGSIKLIMEQVNSWNKSAIIIDKESSANDTVLEAAGKTLDTLLLTNNFVPGENTQDSYINYMDPRTVLTLKAKSQKATHITEFLTEKSKKRRQNRRKEFILRTGSSDAETLVLRTEEEHPYLGILLEEWGAANMRLLNHLLATGKIHRSNIEYYLAYTTRIFEFSEIYEWSSVLHFDHTYRELQAEHQFQWGTFSPHMELQILTPKRVRQNQASGWQGTPLQPREDCRIFKAKGSCPFGVNCRYRHHKPQPAKHAPAPNAPQPTNNSSASM